MKILKLTLKKKWFDLIASGVKTIEYREVKRHWVNRLTDGEGGFRNDYKEVHFTNGYSPDSPSMKVELMFIDLKGANEPPQNDEELQGEWFKIHLGRVLSLKNYEH